MLRMRRGEYTCELCVGEEGTGTSGWSGGEGNDGKGRRKGNDWQNSFAITVRRVVITVHWCF